MHSELDQVHLACRTQSGDHGWMAALGYTDRYWAILDRSGLYEIELNYTDNSTKFTSYRPQICLNRDLASLGPRDCPWASPSGNLSGLGMLNSCFGKSLGPQGTLH